MKAACIIVGILLTAGGIVCMCAKGATITIVSIFIGVLMLVSAVKGLYALYKSGDFRLEKQWEIFGTVFTAVLALAMIFSSKLQGAISVILAIAAGLWVIANGINQICTTVRQRDEITLFGHSLGSNSWFLSFIYGAVIIILGILCVLSPAFFSQALDVLLGIAIVLCGVRIISLGALM